jgi:hypothetical protein
MYEELPKSPTQYLTAQWTKRFLKFLIDFGNVWSIIIGIISTIYIIHRIITTSIVFVMLRGLFGCTYETILGTMCPTTMLVRNYHRKQTEEQNANRKEDIEMNNVNQAESRGLLGYKKRKMKEEIIPTPNLNQVETNPEPAGTELK